MKILVVEDFRAIAKGFSEVLRAQGHDVQCVIGFSDIDKLEAIDIDDQPVTLTAEAYDFALVDGQLEQFNGQPDNPIEGPAVVSRLVKSGVVCFGISTEQKLNAEMVKNGAKNADTKPVSFFAFVHGVVTVEQVVAGDSLAIQRLQDTHTNINSEAYADRRHQCDDIIKRNF
ncbi:MAG: hypothetical protein SGJ27_21270 [Candidatus Melainabacteria bacterium]|nr:hypothetical protein [Candidatus Melainabacteria bacterium]